MRPLRALTALIFALCTLGAQAAAAIDPPGVHAAGRPGQAAMATMADGPFGLPRMPMGALAFAAIGSVFLFRRGRAPTLQDMTDRD